MCLKKMTAIKKVSNVGKPELLIKVKTKKYSKKDIKVILKNHLEQEKPSKSSVSKNQIEQTQYRI